MNETILNMPAGCALNMLISEHVFEHTTEEWNAVFLAGRAQYSEEWNAASQVVAKMREKGFDFYAEWVTEKAVNRHNSMPWACFSPDDGESVYSASGETMPLAIGYAALLAVMGGKQ